ncbi:FAD-binding oxidoreductase [Shimia sp. SDUM112013]|uniref:NAD(P)/FAD-dependent oxidoreductase n=1 Tax=Shimia sp. SDUM112013 TaxID=3136160 RepID=UPI0032EC8EFF
MTGDISSSLWHHSCAETVSTPALADAVDCDLAVIGGGYTGLSAALHGAEAGASVCLIEADSFGSGGSGRNVGLANAGLWLPPEEINDHLGDAAGQRLSGLLARGPDLVFSLIARHKIACEPVQNGTLHCAHAPSGMKDLENRHAQLRAIGAPVSLLGREEAVARVGSERVYGALFDPRAGTIQPLAYAKGLARAALAAGAHLYEKTPANGIARDGNRWLVTTPQGRIMARRLLVATGGYARAMDGLATPEIVPVHYFQAATDPMDPAAQACILPGREGCWDTALVMSSWRLDQAGRLIIGAMGQLGHIGSFAHETWLRRKVTRMFPALAEVPLRQTWHGRIAMTTEHLPKVLCPDPSLMVCFGYSGRGISPGTLFGKHIAEALLNDTPDALPVPPVKVHRLPFAGLRGAYYETGATLTHLVKDRF